MVRAMRRLTLPLLLLLAVGCDDDSDPSPAQAGDMRADATATDGSPGDGPLPEDATPRDAGADQGPAADADVPADATLDQGALDATPDGATPDAGPPADLGLTPDEGPPDADQGVPAACGDWAEQRDLALLTALHAHLHATYAPIEVAPDLGGNPNRYTTARYRMFTEVEFIERDGVMGHEGIYTGQFFPGEAGVEPDDDVINCEHTWPRARMADRATLLYSHQQSDIHHLLPAVNRCNSLRGSFRFGEPVRGLVLDCMPARMGQDANGQQVFEPRDERKGDVARVVLYFAARWGADIVDWEEETLKRWHAEDPVDDRERHRNDVIEGIQGNRNPFIDCPNLVGRIGDFQAIDSLDSDATLPAP